MKLGFQVSTAKDVEEGERRKIAEAPTKFDPAKPEIFLQDEQHYFEDRFGLRKEMIADLAGLRYKLFQETNGDIFWTGRDSVMFSNTNIMGKDTELYQAKEPFTEAMMAKWADALETRRQELEKMGVDYAVMLAPSKTTIYGDKVPAGKLKYGPNRTSMLIDYLHKHTRVKVIDVRPALLEVKNLFKLYNDFDAHWNQIGGLMGYNGLARVLHDRYPGFYEENLADYKFPPSLKEEGELPKLAGLKMLASHPLVSRRIRSRTRAVECEKIPDIVSYRQNVATEVNDPRLPRVLVYFDSFIFAMQSPLGEHCSHVMYVWANNFKEGDLKWVRKDRPQLVIQEMVESKLTIAP